MLYIIAYIHTQIFKEQVFKITRSVYLNKKLNKKNDSSKFSRMINIKTLDI